MGWLLLLVTSAGASFGAVVLALAHRIEQGAFHAPPPRKPPLDLEVTAVGDALRIRALSRAAWKDATLPGVYGVEMEGGYGQVSELLEMDAARRTVVRHFELLRGEPPALPTRARIDGFAFDVDTPGHLTWERVAVDLHEGNAPALLAPASEHRWAIFVHGKGARADECFRLVPVVHAADWTCLAISYRNDVDCMATGRYGYGLDEWEDLDAAVRWAQARGAREVLLVGYSMGGAVCLGFLRRSPLASMVRALILDAPMTDLRSLIHLRSRRMGIPSVLTTAALGLAARRRGLHWHELDYHTSWDHHHIPVLLFHGEADDVIPVELSDRFANGRPNVTYHRVEVAGHVRAWNVDRERYAQAVRDFLACLSEAEPSSGLSAEGGATLPAGS